MTFGKHRVVENPTDNPGAQKRLRAIPNVGPTVAAKFARAGISDIPDLAGRDPDELYENLCAADGVRHDDRLRDIFAAAISYAEGNPIQPWSAFTAARKERDARRAAPKPAPDESRA